VRPSIIARSSLWIAAAAVLAFGLVRFTQQPTFWLDEAFVAVSLRNPSFHSIFAPLEYGQYFPRLYLFSIALLRQLLGYQIWVLRLLPVVSFAAATMLWAKLLGLRSQSTAFAGILGAALLLGSGFWLDQAIQLKQYSFEAALALIPFVLGDAFFETMLGRGGDRWKLAVLALPCLFSYTFPIALAARVAGWCFERGCRGNWKFNSLSALVLCGSVAGAAACLWFTDYRYDLADRAGYLAYWNDCILNIRGGAGPALRLLAKYLWGWHGRMPLVLVGLVPLQALGVYRVVWGWRARANNPSDAGWGSRSSGALFLLIGTALASALASYPICGGRVVLFTQVHTQILAIEGVLFLSTVCWHRAATKAFLFTFVPLVIFYSGKTFVQAIRSEPAENLKPVLPLIDARTADTLWVQSCSVAQVRSLPDPPKIPTILMGSNGQPPPQGRKIWVLWTHMGDPTCTSDMERMRLQAKTWEVVEVGSSRGLALAEF